MPNDEPFYLSPGSAHEPGDVFEDVPFPALKYPLEWFRASPNPKNPGGATVFSAAKGDTPQSGDTARGAFTMRRVILLSHGCEIESVERDVASGHTKFENRYWLVAPVLPLSSCGKKIRARTIEGRQPNKFLLPGDGLLGAEPLFADLRKITPVTVPYFKEATKIASLSRNAEARLHSHLGLFFSGLVLYVQAVSCPNCSTPIDPTLFVIPSPKDEDID